MVSKWEMVRLGDVCEIARGGSPRPIEKYITTEKTGINWIKIGDTSSESMYITETREKIIPEGMKKSRYVQAGDFLLSNSMSFGRPFILKIDGCIHDGWLVLRDKMNHFQKEYLYYALSSKSTYNKFKALAVGGVVNNLNSTIVKQVEFPLPPLEVQKQIAKTFDVASELISLRKKQLAELDNLIKATFYDMFGDPVVNEKGWGVSKLGELCKIVRGGSPRPIEKYLGGTVPWIKIGDATNGDNIYLHNTRESIIEKGVTKSRYIKTGSMIFANCGVSLGFARIITFDGCIHDGWLAFNNISEKLNRIFLLKQLNEMTLYFRGIAPGGTQPNLNTNIMRKVSVIIPPIDRQNQFAEIVTKIEEQKALVQKAIDESQYMFDSLMSQYFE